MQLSKRLTGTPAVMVGQMSSSMYMMMQMLQSSGQIPGGQGGMPEMPKDLTMEINANHPTIVNLNAVRKADPELAKQISLVFLEQVLTSSAIPFDQKESGDRTQRLMEHYMDEILGD